MSKPPTETMSYPPQETEEDVARNLINNPDAIPRYFDERKQFHNPKHVMSVLGLEELDEGTTILDVGSGTNQLVERLNDHGYKAVGLDLYYPELSQRPDVSAMSNAIPFADNSFEVVVNNWGGLTYPLVESTYVEGEVQTESVKTYFKQLQESLRVTSDQVRILPFSIEDSFNSFGCIAQRAPKSDFDKTVKILRIDMQGLFEEAGIEFEQGKTDDKSATEVPSDSTGILRKTEAYTPDPISNLIADLENDDDMWISLEEIDELSPGFKERFMNLASDNGNIHYLTQQNEWLKDTPSRVRTNPKENHEWYAETQGLDIEAVWAGDDNEVAAFAYEANEAFINFLQERREQTIQELIQMFDEVREEVLIY